MTTKKQHTFDTDIPYDAAGGGSGTRVARLQDGKFNSENGDGIESITGLEFKQNSTGSCVPRPEPLTEQCIAQMDFHLESIAKAIPDCDPFLAARAITRRLMAHALWCRENGQALPLKRDIEDQNPNSRAL